MKFRAAILLAVMVSALCRAGDIDPVTWIHTASGAEVFVACYWASQFPRFEGSEKHLLIACPKATWNNASPTKRNKVLTAIRRYLNNDDPVNAATLATLKDALNDANVRVVLTDDPRAQLAQWGLAAPSIDEPK